MRAPIPIFTNTLTAPVLADRAAAIGSHFRVDEDLRDGVARGRAIFGRIVFGEGAHKARRVVDGNILERVRDARDEVVLADHANRLAHWRSPPDCPAPFVERRLLRDEQVRQSSCGRDGAVVRARAGPGHRDYCLGIAVASHDTNCRSGPRFAQMLWNKICEVLSCPFWVTSKSPTPVMIARQPYARTLTLLRLIAR